MPCLHVFAPAFDDDQGFKTEIFFALGRIRMQENLQINNKLQPKTSLLISCYSSSKIFYTNRTV